MTQTETRLPARHESGMVRLSSMAWWLAALVLLLNDHWLKHAGWLSPVVTGKLSDFAGLIVAPPTLCALCRVRKRSGKLLCLAATGVAFSMLNLWPAAARGVELATALLGLPWRVWSDPSDLLALPALGVSWWLMTRRTRPRRTAARTAHEPPALWLHRVAAAVGALACTATSYVPPASVQTTQVESGRVYATSRLGGSVFVLDQRSGKRIAKLRLDLVPEESWVAGSDVVYAAGAGEGIRAFRVDPLHAEQSPAEGKQLFRRPRACGNCPVRLVLGERQLFVLSLEEGEAGPFASVLALDRQSGRLSWSTKLGALENFAEDQSDLPQFHRGQLLVPTQTGLWGLDARNGRLEPLDTSGQVKWVTPAAERAYYMLTGPRGTHTLVELDLDRRRVLWRHAIDEPYQRSRYWGQPLGVAGSALVYATAHEVIALDQKSKRELWRKRYTHEQVAIDDGLVFATTGDSSGNFSAFDAQTGQRRWTVTLDNEPYAPTMVQGVLLLRAQAALLMALDSSSGRSLWTVDLAADD